MLSLNDRASSPKSIGSRADQHRIERLETHRPDTIGELVRPKRLVVHTWTLTSRSKRVKRLLANTTRFLAKSISAADADDDAKACSIDGAIH